MTIEQTLMQRADSQCELCGAQTTLSVFEVPQSNLQDADHCVLTCQTCQEQINNPEQMDENHWRCLNDSMWSPVPAVQVMAWRLLTRLAAKGWPQDLLDSMYMEEDVAEWAKAAQNEQSEEPSEATLDCNGNALQAGDNVTIIKDLEVKGAGFTAKRGTAVRNIGLTNNPEHIEGRVNGTRIVLKTCFLKKQ